MSYKYFSLRIGPSRSYKGISMLGLEAHLRSASMHWYGARVRVGVAVLASKLANLIFELARLHHEAS